MDFCGGMRWFCGDYHASCDFSSNITWLQQKPCCISSHLCALRFWQPVKLRVFNSRFLFLARCEVPFSSDLCCIHCHDPSLGCYCQAKSFPGRSPEVWLAAGHCCHEHQQVKEAQLPALCAHCRGTLGSLRGPPKVTLAATAGGYLPRASQPLVTLQQTLLWFCKILKYCSHLLQHLLLLQNNLLPEKILRFFGFFRLPLVLLSPV